MKGEMKSLQKRLSKLREQFDEYVKSKPSKRPLDNNNVESHTKRKRLEPSDRTSLNINSDGYLVVYTDGACQMNGSKSANAGIGVYFGPHHPM